MRLSPDENYVANQGLEESRNSVEAVGEEDCFGKNGHLETWVGRESVGMILGVRAETGRIDSGTVNCEFAAVTGSKGQ